MSAISNVGALLRLSGLRAAAHWYVRWRTEGQGNKVHKDFSGSGRENDSPCLRNSSTG